MASAPIKNGPPPVTLSAYGAPRAPAGAVAFHRFLETLNRQPPPHHQPPRREPDRFEPSPCRAGPPTWPALLPRLGRTPVIAAPRLPAPAPAPHPGPATGRLIDLLA